MRRCEVCSTVDTSAQAGWRMLRRGDRHVDVCPACMKKLEVPSPQVWGHAWEPGGKW